jgi:hypothetical protein
MLWSLAVGQFRDGGTRVWRSMYWGQFIWSTLGRHRKYESSWLSLLRLKKLTAGRAQGLDSMASQLPIYTGTKTATLPPRTVDLDSRVELVDHTAARPEPHLGANTRRGGAGNLI